MYSSFFSLLSGKKSFFLFKDSSSIFVNDLIYLDYFQASKINISPFFIYIFNPSSSVSFAIYLQ